MSLLLPEWWIVCNFSVSICLQLLRWLHWDELCCKYNLFQQSKFVARKIIKLLQKRVITIANGVGFFGTYFPCVLIVLLALTLLSRTRR